MTIEEKRERRRISQKKYRENHPDKIKEQQKKWVEKNKDKIKEYRKKYYEEHIEKSKELNEYRKKYAREHKEQAKQNIKKFQEKHDWVKYCADRRRARVERLKAQGVTNAWMVVTKSVEPKYKNNSTN